MLVLRHYSASEIPKCSKYNTRNTFIKVPYKWWHISVSYSMLESQHSSRRVIRVTGNFHDRQEMVFSWKLAAVKSRIVEFWFVFFFPLSFSPSLSLSLAVIYVQLLRNTILSLIFIFTSMHRERCFSYFSEHYRAQAICCAIVRSISRVVPDRTTRCN